MRPSLSQSLELDLFCQQLLDEFKVPGVTIAIIDGENNSTKVSFEDFVSFRPEAYLIHVIRTLAHHVYQTRRSRIGLFSTQLLAPNHLQQQP
jgi:hypothetical protein